ncbi:MAG: COG2426 family protein [Flavisolibacter sp.]
MLFTVMLAYETLFFSFLLSISPFGEARSGIPYAVFNDVHIAWAFAVGLVGNLLVYPLLIWLIETFNMRLWKYRGYKKSVLKLSRMARKGAGSHVGKYGFWGLMVFVMIPLPGTGAYMGTIAAALFRIEKRQAFAAISLGILISCIIMIVVSYLGVKGIQSF